MSYKRERIVGLVSSLSTRRTRNTKLCGTLGIEKLSVPFFNRLSVPRAVPRLWEHWEQESQGSSACGVESVKEVPNLYSLPDELRRDLKALIEFGNQIVHPSPLPFGRPSWPAPLQRLRDQKVIDGNTPQARWVSSPGFTSDVRMGNPAMRRSTRRRR